ncbi:murein biosynthesis integral membrane protein MurJ [Cellulomonas composti]|uniref:Membrane protein n=1 Tax=Cellulomonas composti TaxID=266130 RepID=A0A511J5S0_9CELL|nr:lipid II flippase MurJ [Cellulomonas composti]GEL93352.1 membrane protein [Cellulomonas composti]
MSASRRPLTGLAGAAAMIAGITVLSRVLGFVRLLLLAAAVGSVAIADAYNSANVLPNVLFEIAAGGALAGAVVPLLAGPIARGSRAEIDRTASGALGWTLLVLVPLAALLAACSGLIARWLGHGDPALVDAVRFFVLVFSLQVPMYGVAVLLYAVLQSHRRFFWPAFAPVLFSLVLIATYLVYGAMADGERSDPSALPHGALSVLAWGTTLGVAAMCLPMFWPVRALGVRLRPTLHFPPGVATRLRTLALAGVGSVAAQQIALVVVLAASSWAVAGKGTYTAFMFTQQVYLLPYAVLVVPLATSTFPRLAQRASRGDRAGFASMAAVTTRGVVVAAACGVAAVVAAAVAIGTIFAAIAHDPGLAPRMADGLVWMMPGLIGFAALFHGSRSLYALERGRAAVIANVVGWGVFAVFVVVLVPAQVPGDDAVTSIAAASSIGMLVGGTTALVALRRAAGPGALAGLARTGAVLTVATVAGSVVGRWVGDVVQDVAGGSAMTGVGAALGAGVVAAGTVLGAVALFDRGTVTGILRAERERVLDGGSRPVG